jgi:hypothetical protein
LTQQDTRGSLRLLALDGTLLGPSFACEVTPMGHRAATGLVLHKYDRERPGKKMW